MRLIEALDYQDMSRKAARFILDQVKEKPDCVLGLATGSTPIGLYEQLIEWHKKGELDFSRVTSFNLDEYCGLAPEHEQSYHFFMNEKLFRHVNFESSHVPSGLAEDAELCADYDRQIADRGGIDLQLLGLGHTGHIAFNEPGDSFSTGTHKVALAEETIEANSRFFESRDEVPRFAVTMGIGTIMAARKILLVVNGTGKAEILKKALFGPVTPQVPASILQFHPDVVIVADTDALSAIRQEGLF